jgi:hypothetical protein
MVLRIVDCVSIVVVLTLTAGCSGPEASSQKAGSPQESDSSPKKVKLPTGEVLAGKVTYNGAPVTGGTIKLVEVDGKVIDGAILRDGTYKFNFLSLGDKKVAIETESIKNEMKDYDQRAKNPPPGMDIVPRKYVRVYVLIPSKYAKAETSGLTATIKKGENAQDFHLTD